MGSKQRILVLAPFGRDAAEIGRVLGAADFDVTPCGDVGQWCTGIQQDAAAALVAEEALSDEARSRIAATLARQPSWSDLPLLIMTSRSRHDRDGWHALRGFEKTTQVRLLERPLTTAMLVSAVRAAVESRQRQYQVRDELVARRQAEAALRRGQELSAVLNRINTVIHTTLEPDEILRSLIVEGTKVLGCETAAVSLRRADDWIVRFIHGLPNELLGATISDQEAYHALLAIDNRVPVAIEDAWADQRVNPERMRKHNIRAVLVVPLFVRQSPLGVAFFNCHRGPRSFSEAEVDFARQLATAASIALENVRLLNEHRQAEDRLAALNETLEAQVAERTSVAERRAEDLRRLATELTDAEHRERRRLARLLHDDLQQLLLAAKLRLPVLIEGDPGQLEQYVEKIDELLAECMSTSRNLTQELSPPVLEHGSLPEVFGWVGGWFNEKHGLTVGLNVGESTPTASEHMRVFLFEAVRELLFNVVKHSGRMEAQVGLSFQKGAFVVQVEDDGDGFNPEAIEARLKKPEGFGLFNIRERLEALGGRLEFDRGTSGGACFRLFVPADGTEHVQPEPPTEARGRSTVRDARPEIIRLLVVDDHQVVREGMVGVLNRQKDLEVIGEAADGFEAIEQVGTLHPDAVIMDVDMPGMNGIDATREIKRRWEETVVVGLSLHEEDGIHRAMVEAGAEGYISKHAPAKELVAAIRHLCG
jgi:signal transduction histidine kinase/CheY-like chemotaxis protein